MFTKLPKWCSLLLSRLAFHFWFPVSGSKFDWIEFEKDSFSGGGVEAIAGGGAGVVGAVCSDAKNGLIELSVFGLVLEPRSTGFRTLEKLDLATEAPVPPTDLPPTIFLLFNSKLKCALPDKVGSAFLK